LQALASPCIGYEPKARVMTKMATSNLHSMNILVFTYLMLQMFMTTYAQREARKAMMALALNMALKKVYGANLPQGLQHEFAQVREDKFPMEEDEIILD
jgi:hypothetical protein